MLAKISARGCQKKLLRKNLEGVESTPIHCRVNGACIEGGKQPAIFTIANFRRKTKSMAKIFGKCAWNLLQSTFLHKSKITNVGMRMRELRRAGCSSPSIPEGHNRSSRYPIELKLFVRISKGPFTNGVNPFWHFSDPLPRVVNLIGKFLLIFSYGCQLLGDPLPPPSS